MKFPDLLLQHALTYARKANLLDQLDPLLLDWEALEGCSFATAFQFRRNTSEVRIFNGLPQPDSSDAQIYHQYHQAFCALINPESEQVPEVAELPWDVFRRETEDAGSSAAVPAVLLSSDSAFADAEDALDQFSVTKMDIIKDEELQEFLKAPIECARGKLEGTVAPSTEELRGCNLHVFGWAPVCLGDKLRALRADRKCQETGQQYEARRTDAVVYILGTRKHFNEVASSYDFGLMVGLAAPATAEDYSLSSVVYALSAAWNTVAVPIYLQMRESRFARLQAGRDVIHTLKTYLGMVVRPQLDRIIERINRGHYNGNQDDAKRDTDTVLKGLYVYPHFASFIARSPCSQSQDGETLRPEDVQNEYDPVGLVLEYCKKELTVQRTHQETAFTVLPLAPASCLLVTFINSQYLKLALSEAVENIWHYGLREKLVTVSAWLSKDPNIFCIELKNAPKPESTWDGRIRPGHGLNVLRAFCEAAGGTMHEPKVSSEEVCIQIEIGLAPFKNYEPSRRIVKEKKYG